MSPLKIWSAAIFAAAAVLPSLPQSGSAATDREFTDFKLITDRNIFDPNRQAPRPPRPTTPRQVVDSFSFAGTMTYPKGLFAFFDGTSSDYRKVMEAGETIAGYEVKEIGHDLVRLAMDTNEVKLTVGMQMRRGTDGKWTPAEASAAGPASVASNSRSTFGRSDNRDRDRGRGREDWRSAASGRQAGGTQPSAGAEISTGGTGDTIEMLRRRRMQETGEIPAGDAPVSQGQFEPELAGEDEQENSFPINARIQNVIRLQNQDQAIAQGQEGPVSNDGPAGNGGNGLNRNDNTNRSDEN